LAAFPAETDPADRAIRMALAPGQGNSIRPCAAAALASPMTVQTRAQAIRQCALRADHAFVHIRARRAAA